MIATEPVIAPATSFSTMRIEFDAIDSAAARVLTVPRPATLPAIKGPAIRSVWQQGKQRPRGAAAVADRVLLLGGELRHRTAVGDIVGQERRVVAEAAV